MPLFRTPALQGGEHVSGDRRVTTAELQDWGSCDAGMVALAREFPAGAPSRKSSRDPWRLAGMILRGGFWLRRGRMGISAPRDLTGRFSPERMPGPCKEYCARER